MQYINPITDARNKFILSNSQIFSSACAPVRKEGLAAKVDATIAFACS
jgi:hypothetical protein